MLPEELAARTKVIQQWRIDGRASALRSNRTASSSSPGPVYAERGWHLAFDLIKAAPDDMPILGRLPSVPLRPSARPLAAGDHAKESASAMLSDIPIQTAATCSKACRKPMAVRSDTIHFSVSVISDLPDCLVAWTLSPTDWEDAWRDCTTKTRPIFTAVSSFPPGNIDQDEHGQCAYSELPESGVS